jgi:hypothetical protein
VRRYVQVRAQIARATRARSAKAACGGTTCREYRELESLIAAKGR